MMIASQPSQRPASEQRAPPRPITYEIRSGRRAATRAALLLPSIRPIADGRDTASSLGDGLEVAAEPVFGVVSQLASVPPVTRSFVPRHDA